MNKSSQLLIELPSMLSHIVTKRGRVLRDGGSSGVSTLLKEKSKAWVATSVAATTKKQPWDEAHEVAAKLKKEFGSAVYVEPDGTAGRFQELTSPGTSLDFDSKEGADPFAGRPFGQQQFGQGQNQNIGGFAGLVNIGCRASRGQPGGLGGFDSMMGMPSIPSPTDFLPKQVCDLMGAKSTDGKAGKPKLSFPALRSAPGFSELPEAPQQMFEVEAAQLMNNGYQSQTGLDVVDDYSAIVVLALQNGISKALKKFVEQATAVGQPFNDSRS